MGLQHILGRIADALEASAANNRLWSIADVADYLNYSDKIVRQIKDRPGFPVPIVVSGQPRYVPEEIRAWALKQRG